MTVTPDTRASLILRLKDRHDNHAWSTFVEIYQPLFKRLCMRANMQPADAHEATQEILLHLSNVVEKWDPDKELGSFRGWLHQVSKNVVVRFLQNKNRRLLITGKSDIHQLLNECPDPTVKQTRDFDIEFRRRVFGWACDQLQNEFRHQTWQAFLQTQVMRNDIETVAKELGLSVGAVYVARSRVMKRLREIVQKQIDTDWNQFEIENA